VTAVKMRSSHRVTFIERFYQRGLKQQFSPAQVNNNEEAIP
jgi:hypothetical protein